MNSFHERTLKRAGYSCAEPEYVSFRQDAIRDAVQRIAEAEGDDGRALRESCRIALSSERDELLSGAIAYLFVLGELVDIERLRPLLNHADPNIAKAVRTCIFEIKHRG